MSWLAIYDGSFPGLLCLCEEALGSAGTPAAVATGQAQLTLFDEPRQIVTEPDRAMVFWRGLAVRLSRDSLRNVACVHLHGGGGHELATIGYLRLGHEMGEALDGCLTDPGVAEVQRRVGQVRLESHRLKGLVRFRRLRDGVYYASLRPDHRVLYMVARHFVRRLRNDRWVLHDVGRGEALLWDGRELREWSLSATFADNCGMKDGVGEEREMEELWRIFHRAIAVPGRDKARLQRQFMPRRYWPYLTEMGE